MKRVFVYMLSVFFLLSTISPNLLAAEMPKQALDPVEVQQLMALDAGQMDHLIAGELSQGAKTGLIIFAFLLALGSLIATLNEADSLGG